MAAALYDPEQGYYARSSRQVGRAGDFFTSVSTGPVFGRLLAERIAAWHREAGSPARWRVVELGAHDGQLAIDLLRGLAEIGVCGVQYAILEPLATLAEAQRANLDAAGLTATIHAGVEELSGDPLPTYLLANEVLDALPCHLVESDGDAWREIGVASGPDGQLTFCDLGPASEIAANLPVRPKGYRTEVRPDFEDFLRPLASLLQPGRMLWIDYGFSRSSYYDESRSEGTLRTFSSHQAGDDPLVRPGEIDITAHVDFTAVAEAALALGGSITLFEDQGRCLTRWAHGWLSAREGMTGPEVRKELLAFQTLIHPAHLGARFHLLEASFGEGLPHDPAALARLECVP